MRVLFVFVPPLEMGNGLVSAKEVSVGVPENAGSVVAPWPMSTVFVPPAAVAETAFVPSPTSTPWDVRLVLPVPPFATCTGLARAY